MAYVPGLAQAANRASRIYGVQVTPRLLGALVRQESGGNQAARSPAGAIGYTQLMPGTAAGLHVDPYNPQQNLMGGARYFAQQLARFHTIPLALAAYNAGPGAVTAAGNRIPQISQTQNYVKSIMAMMGQDGGPAVSSTVPGAAAAPLSASRVGATTGAPTGPDPGLGRQALLQLMGLFGSDRPDYGGFGRALSAYRGSSVPAPLAAGGAGTAPRVPIPTRGVAASGPQASMEMLGATGKLIGSPYKGTHRLGNWQSDNAVDVALPVGTPVYAPVSGKLGNTGYLGDPKDTGRFAGQRVNLFGGGQGFYFAHLSKLAPSIKNGATVKKGQLLGYTGAANGVAHLHFGVENGTPYTYLPDQGGRHA